jgi:hypothetical protein
MEETSNHLEEIYSSNGGRRGCPQNKSTKVKPALTPNSLPEDWY